MTINPYWIGAPSGVLLFLAVLALTAAVVIVIGRMPDRSDDREDS